MAAKYDRYRPTRHHLYFPRKAYRTPLEIAFRELPQNIVLLPDHIHQLLHKHQPPPDKPSVEEMEQAVRLFKEYGYEG